MKGSIEVSFLLSYTGDGLGFLAAKHEGAPLGGASEGYLDQDGDYIKGKSPRL